jgi:hypothetical protein
LNSAKVNLQDFINRAINAASPTPHLTMAPKRGGSRRSYNPITGVYNAFVVSENAPIVRSVTAFGVSPAPSRRRNASADSQTGCRHLPGHRICRGYSLVGTPRPLALVRY